MKEPGLDGRHRDKSGPKKGGNSAEAQRHAEQESAEADSRVFAERDARDNAQENWKDQ